MVSNADVTGLAPKDNDMTTPIAQGPVDVNVSRCTVRVKTTAWADKRGLHTKKA